MVASTKASEHSGMTPEERTNQIFKRMDKNADDKLTMTEFMEGVKEVPSIVNFLQEDA
jgi:Ca2+-binding EF-hand superfamily protein